MWNSAKPIVNGCSSSRAAVCVEGGEPSENGEELRDLRVLLEELEGAGVGLLDLLGVALHGQESPGQAGLESDLLGGALGSRGCLGQ